MSGTVKKIFNQLIETVFSLDLRSLALFRISFALVILTDLLIRSRNLVSHYTDDGILPLAALSTVSKPFYWSLFALSGQPLVQFVLFVLAILTGLLFLIGYRTRIATIVLWVFIISLHNRNPALIFAGDDVLRAILFWSMFLPLGAAYSVDSALNTATKPLPKQIISEATVAFMVQLAYIYIWSAFYKAKSDLWFPKGDAVYYALSFDQYGTHFGQFLLGFPEDILRLLTVGALWFETFGPLLIFIPLYNTAFRWIAICSFILLHIGFGLSFALGIFPFLSISCWLALLPTSFWDTLEERLATPTRKGLTIYYDVDCGFCKKVVHFLRTFLILPQTPLLEAQSDESIHADMLEQNSWVVVDWQGKRHFKWSGLAYVVSLSPLFGFLAVLMRLKPIMKVGTRFYETIASNRKTAGVFTRYFKFAPLQIRHSVTFNILTLTILLFVTIWNFKAYVDQTFILRTELQKDWITTTHNLFNKSTVQKIDILAKATRLDQSWSIFAPNPPRDDGWYVIIGDLKDGRQVNLLTGSSKINWEKPTIEERNDLYGDMQWRTFFINLNRSIGGKLYPYYGKYLCNSWNRKHPENEQIKDINVYFMDERTVPPGEKQTVKKENPWQQSCS